MKLILTILMLAGLAATASADTPEVDDTFFHPAASFYIHGDATSASNLVAQGLSQYPDDGKLKRLKELLEKQQQQQKNQEQQQDQQDQEKQNQQDQEQEPQEQDEQEPQEQDEQEQQEQQAEQPPPRAEQMSQDEAEQLLDAMKQEEKNKRLELRPVLGNPVKVEKDW